MRTSSQPQPNNRRIDEIMRSWLRDLGSSWQRELQEGLGGSGADRRDVTSGPEDPTAPVKEAPASPNRKGRPGRKRRRR